MFVPGGCLFFCCISVTKKPYGSEYVAFFGFFPKKVA